MSDIAIDEEGEGIIVTMQIDEGVPLPAEAKAAIQPVSLIGERNVSIGPAWKPGQRKLAAGDEIPVERTIIPTEPDEALQVVTELVQALDPESVRSLLAETAGALDGNGRTINETVAQLAELLPYLAQQDDELLDIAADVRVLADVVERRDQQIGQLLDDFAAVSGVLAEERDAIVGFLDALVSLTQQGEALLSAYEVSLPEDLETIASVALTVKVNADNVQQLVTGLESLNGAVVGAYDAETESLRTRIVTSRTVLSPLTALLDALGLPAPCLPDVTCTP